jgi:hypothetical protein
MATLDDIGGVGSLFGLNPSSLNAQREQQYMDFASKVANAEAIRPGAGSVLGANVMGARGVAQLGNLFGVQDPLMQRVSQQQQLLGGVDFTDLESLKTASQQASQAGRPDIAQELAKRALELQTKVEEKQANRENQMLMLRERLNTQLDVAKQRGADQKEIAAMQIEGRNQIAALMAAQKQSLIDLKNYEKAQTAEQKVQAATDNADRVINTVKKAIPLVGYNTAGAAGSLNIPGTEGRDLETELLTIKSNLGFDRLQQMRDASKTGGALGNVAVKELEALQSTVASLDRGQSPDKLKNNLKDIEYYYTRWRKAVNGEDPGPAVRPSEKTKTGGAKTRTLKSGVVVTEE